MINPDESLAQNTGVLSVDSKGRVKRALQMATYENGRARPLDIPLMRELTSGLKP